MKVANSLSSFGATASENSSENSQAITRRMSLIRERRCGRCKSLNFVRFVDEKYDGSKEEIEIDTIWKERERERKREIAEDLRDRSFRVEQVAYCSPSGRKTKFDQILLRSHKTDHRLPDVLGYGADK
ncbi:hypothetical protein HZH68_004046 [Vespula germanica]|uniref:Uncharacterized protein n=1 Tax=Vespula germanica TaxID=30212 RepID=A0A834NGV2_VESGE|nr:hypothetical protein HZH68_004046 [Vespula germanica]